MYARASRTVVAAMLLAGCIGRIDAPGEGSGTASGTGNGTGTGDGTDTGDGTAIGPDGQPVGGSADPTVCVPGVPETSQLPRLTRVQYDNTIQDLLGLGGEPSSMLAPDSTGSVDQRAWDGYQMAAETLAAEVMVDPQARAKVIPCAPSGDGAACARQFIEQFGVRAFRRPLTTEEIARFEALYTTRAELTPTGSFDEAIELILHTFLLSPSFLTRAEITEQPDGNYLALNGYEVASRLSYMLWGSMPDDSLFTAAADGSLATPEGIRAQAERMLSDPKARGMVTAFHEHYLHMGPGTRWTSIVRDPELYPAFKDTLVPLMTEETERFLDYTVFDQGGTFQDLILSPVAFVNAELAPVYGLDATQYGSDFQQVSLDPSTRAGVFTRAGFLASHSVYDRTSPILRGAFLQKEVLCTSIPAPPPDAESTPLPTEGTTVRERVSAQTSPTECAGCHHTYINPTGFALEAYDAIGAYQTTEAFSGAAIDSSASVHVGDDKYVDVAGPVEMMTAIAASPAAHRCYAQKWVMHAYEREINNADSCTVDNLTTKLTQGGYTVLNLIIDLTQSDSFRYRAVPAEVAP
jgi:hypothetical protein